MPKPEKSRAWQSVSACAELFGVSRPTVATGWLSQLPPSAVEIRGREKFLHVPTLKRIVFDVGDSDLVRRKAEIEIEKMEADLRKRLREEAIAAGEYIAVAELHRVLERMGSHIRSFGERLQMKKNLNGQAVVRDLNASLRRYADEYAKQSPIESGYSPKHFRFDETGNIGSSIDG